MWEVGRRGGKSCEFLEAAKSWTLAQRGRVQLVAFQRPWWFRYPYQLGAPLGSRGVATTIGQRSLGAAFNHIKVCLRLLVTDRAERAVSGQWTVLFDKLRPKELARSADAMDMELDIDKESMQVDEVLLEQK